MTIISFKHKFIFIKTRKVAGTSLEVALRKFLGGDDIVPPTTPRDDYYALNNGWTTWNYAENVADEDEYTKLVAAEKFEQAIKHEGSTKKFFSTHMYARAIKPILEQRGHRWEDFLVFTIERHPYSWLLSGCLYDNRVYNLGGKAAYDVADVEQRAKDLLIPQRLNDRRNWDLYTENDKLLVNRVLRYENLPDELNSVMRELGLDSARLELPDLKKNARHLDAANILSENIKKRIYKSFQPTFELLNYAP